MSEETQPAEATSQEPVVEPSQDDPAKTAIEAENAGLQKLSADELIDIIRTTRNEAKTRRLKNRELEEFISATNKQKKLDEEALLEKNKEFETLYGTLKNDTADYEELKDFKMNYLNNCKTKIEDLQKGLTKAEDELFQITAKNVPYDEQLVFIEKLVGNRQTQSVIDKTQSTSRGVEGEGEQKPPVPFGSGTLTQNIMDSLNKASKQIK